MWRLARRIKGACACMAWCWPCGYGLGRPHRGRGEMVSRIADALVALGGVVFELVVAVVVLVSPRTSEQMARVENIIVIQGKKAAEAFAAMLAPAQT